MKDTYEKIEIEIKEINCDDVITTSSPTTSQKENAYFSFDDLIDDLFGETYFD